MESRAAQICKPKSSASRRRTPGFLRHSPINALEQIAQLRRRDRHRPIGRRRPQKPPSLEPFREQAHPLAVVPKAFDEIAAATAKDEQMAAMRIAIQRLLHHQRKAVEPLAHIGVARRQPHSYARRDRDHRRDSALATRASDNASTSAPTMIRSPLLSTISIRPIEPGAVAIALGVASTTLTGTMFTGAPSLTPPTRRSRRRHVNSMLAFRP